MTKGDFLQTRFRQSEEKISSKGIHADFARVWHPLTCWLSKGLLKRYFLETGLIKSFIASNFQKKVAMTMKFFSKWLKFDVDCRKRTKESLKVFDFKDNSILIGDVKISLSRTGYLSLAVNVLRNTPKI